MARPKTQELVAEEVRKALLEHKETQNGDLTEEEMNQQEEEAIQSGEDSDVFDLAVERMQKFNDSVYYEIYKDGTRLCTKGHPYSWDQIQKEFGAGFYRVVGKSLRTKRAFKHSTLSLAPPVDEEREAFSFEEKPVNTPPTQGTSMADMLMFLERQEEKRRRELELLEDRRRQEAREASERSAQTLNTIVAAVSTILPPLLGRREEPKGMDQTVLDFLRSTVETQNKVIEKLQDRIERSTSATQDPLSAFKLMQDMQDRAFSQVKMMEELAKEKAEEIASYAGGGDDKPKSMFESMLSTLAPAIAQGVVQMSNQNQLESAEELEETPNVRRLERRTAAQAPHVANRGRVEEAPRSQGSSQPRQAGHPGQGNAPIRSSEAPKSVMGLPTAKISPKPQVLPAESATAVTETKEVTMKEKILNTLVPYIGSALKARTQANEAALHSVTLLKQANIEPALAVQEFTIETMKETSAYGNIPVIFRGAVDLWLTEYLAALTEQSARSAS